MNSRETAHWGHWSFKKQENRGETTAAFEQKQALRLWHGGLVFPRLALSHINFPSRQQRGKTNSTAVAFFKARLHIKGKQGAQQDAGLLL